MDSDKVSIDDRSWINNLYQQFQPKATRVILNISKGTQLKGIDIYLEKNGEWLTIDEKIRWQDYGENDILLEEYSNYEIKTPGWTWDSKKINNYIAYIIIPNHKFWILDASKLRELWKIEYSNWLQKYNRKFGKTYNKSGELLYQTSNIPVPISQLETTIVFTNQNFQSFY